MLAWFKRLFCRHEYKLYVIGNFEEELVRCKKCGAPSPIYDESDE